MLRRLDPRLFQRVVHVLRFAPAGAARGVDGVVMIAQAQGHTIGGPA